jgi:hypothetical protein
LLYFVSGQLQLIEYVEDGDACMPSFTTVYRAAVMIAAGVIIVKGWQLYGPSAEQVKSFAVSAMDTAQSAWNKSRGQDADATNANDPRMTTPPTAASPPAAPASSAPLNAAPSLALGNTSTVVEAPELNAASTTTLDPEPPSSGNDKTADARVETGDLSALFSQLAEMGASDQQLAPWGSSGQLYRFACRAKLGDTPFHTRHFEAVAAQPDAAVERVVAAVAAWRAGQRQQTAFR